MSNTFFEIDSPEKHDEVYNKWLKVTPQEQKALNVPKSRIYVSVADIDTLQDALQVMIEAESRLSGLPPTNERKLRQMGYALEEIKNKLKKRVAKSNGN